MRRAVLTGHAAEDAAEADRRDALAAALLLGALYAPKDAGKQVTAWLRGHGLAGEDGALAQDAAQVWLATDAYWYLAETETTDG